MEGHLSEVLHGTSCAGLFRLQVLLRIVRGAGSVLCFNGSDNPLHLTSFLYPCLSFVRGSQWIPSSGGHPSQPVVDIPALAQRESTVQYILATISAIVHAVD